MTSAAPQLYVLTDAPAGDPLDCIAAATPILAERYAAVHFVGPERDLSLRAMRRAYEPVEDRLLFDFTTSASHDWAIPILNETPGAVLLGAYPPSKPIAAGPDLRSAARYGAAALRFPPAALVGALDPTPHSAAAIALMRPAIAPPSHEVEAVLTLAVSPGAIETAYAALLGMISYPDPLALIALNRRDANDLTDIVGAFGISGARVRYARNRADIAALVGNASGLIDVTTGAQPGRGDAAFVALCAGAPVLTLATPHQAGRRAAEFTASDPGRDANRAQSFGGERTAEAFAEDLCVLIEAGFQRSPRDAAA